MTSEALLRSASTLARDRRLRIAVAVVGFALVTLVTALIAHPSMFSSFARYDDEGYMLTALKGFVNHGELYDRVFTQYGPFYYEFWGGLFSVFGIDVTHDSGRTVVTVVWVLSSLVFGLATLRMTRSIVLGLGVQILSFAVLTALIAEPMHPVGIIALILAALLAVATFVGEDESPYATALLGALAAALVLVKVNVGVFAVISIAFACVVSYPVLRRWAWPRLGLESLFVALPILLMLGKFSEAWARHYAVHVAVAALAVVLVLRAREPGRRASGDLRWLIGGFVLLVVVSLATILAVGTSVHGLLDGVISQPLRLADAYFNPFQISNRVWAFDAIGLGGAVAYGFAARHRRGEQGRGWYATWSLVSIAIGVTMALSATGRLLPYDATALPGYQLSMLSFAWVGLIATVPGEEPRPRFARLLLPLLAVLQSLHAYPVAGSQIALSALLLVPLGALCVADGVRGLAATLELDTDRLALGGLAALAAVVLAWFCVNTFLREPLHESRGAYHAGVSLDLPGSADMHLTPEEAALYTEVADGIRENCTATLMEPGMDSFYLWSGQEPPSYTATAWEVIFDEEAQQKVIDDTKGLKGLCLLRNPEIATLWGVKEGILTRYLEEGFEPVASWGGYELLRRPGRGA